LPRLSLSLSLSHTHTLSLTLTLTLTPHTHTHTHTHTPNPPSPLSAGRARCPWPRTRARCGSALQIAGYRVGAARCIRRMYAYTRQIHMYAYTRRIYQRIITSAGGAGGAGAGGGRRRRWRLGGAGEHVPARAGVPGPYGNVTPPVPPPTPSISIDQTRAGGGIQMGPQRGYTGAWTGGGFQVRALYAHRGPCTRPCSCRGRARKLQADRQRQTSAKEAARGVRIEACVEGVHSEEETNSAPSSAPPSVQRRGDTRNMCSDDGIHGIDYECAAECARRYSDEGIHGIRPSARADALAACLGDARATRRAHARTRTRTRKYIRARVHARTRAYTHARAHAHASTYARAYTHARAHARISTPPHPLLPPRPRPRPPIHTHARGRRGGWRAGSWA
jgi:hypothetical protein